MKEFKWKPQDIYNKVCEYLENLNQNEEIYIWSNKKETKEIRTKKQNNMFYWLFWEIWKHLWYSDYEVKSYFLSYFWTKEIDFFWEKREVNIINETSKLEKEQAIFFIEIIKAFIEKNNIPCRYSSLDFQNLINTYNL